VLVARDTRPHSERLASLALDGVAHMGSACTGDDRGLLTTPQLHHIVRHLNGQAAAGEHVGSVHWASESGYCEMLSSAYGALFPPTIQRSPLWVDCAGGIGAPQLATLAKAMGSHMLPLTLANTVGECELNKGCGAEFVQKGRLPPRGLEAPLPAVERACSVDGDADRIVFHFWRSINGTPTWRLLDGDKIAALFSAFIIEQLDTLALHPPLSMAVVQTAYANGAAGAYIRSLGVTTRLAKTGVKYVHHVATQYDLAVYFEANGHGTLLFSDRALSMIQAARDTARDAGDAPKEAAATRLLLVKQLINQAIGDALSDLLLVEGILSHRGWGLAEWDDLYEDLPSRQTKLAVADRTALTVSDDETRTLVPAALQVQLDALAAATECGRCFVRPSGTEDVVRVYAEAKSVEAADALALQVAQATWRLAGGVGEMPTSV